MTVNGRLRVLHVLPSHALDKGGPSRSVTGLAEAQAAAGAEVCLITGGRDSDGRDNGGRGLRIVCRGQLPVGFEIPGLALMGRLRAEIRRAHIVHLHSIWNGTVSAAAALCRVIGAPFVVSPRGMLDAANIRHRRLFKALYYRLLDRANLGAASGWHFLDETEREGCRWMNLAGRHDGALISPNGLDVEGAWRKAIKPQATPLFHDGAELNLVFLGRLHPIKGLELQLEVVRLLARRGLRPHLYLVGPDDGCRQLLARTAKELGLADRITFRGPVYGDERYAMLRQADAVLLTSHYECNSNTAAETLAVGGLLIATDTCHLDRPGAAGAAVVVPRRAADVAQAVVQSTAPRRADGIRVAARAYSRQYLAWPVIAAEGLAFYGKILREHG